MKLPYTWNRALAGLLLVAILFSAANYYLELGFFGRRAKLVMVLVLGAITAYGAFVMPTRQEMQERQAGNRMTKNSTDT